MEIVLKIVAMCFFVWRVESSKDSLHKATRAFVRYQATGEEIHFACGCKLLAITPGEWMGYAVYASYCVVKMQLEEDYLWLYEIAITACAMSLLTWGGLMTWILHRFMKNFGKEKAFKNLVINMLIADVFFVGIIIIVACIF